MDMIRLFDNGVTIQSGKPVAAIAAQAGAKEKTIAAKILAAHDHPAQDGQMHITFDGLISHDITYVGIPDGKSERFDPLSGPLCADELS